jgi:hypothetical protein
MGHGMGYGNKLGWVAENRLRPLVLIAELSRVMHHQQWTGA